MTQEYNMAPLNVKWDYLATKSQYSYLVNNNKKTMVEDFGNGFKLYSLPTKFFVIKEDSQDLTYFVSYEEHTVKFINPTTNSETVKKVTTQLKVWREQSHVDAKSLSLSRDMFMDYLLPLHGVMLSDGSHTEFGAGFWRKMAGYAFNMGYKVGFLNMNNKIAMYVENQQEFLKQVDKFYGDEKRHHAQRLFIEK
jgi:hypothetical protein